MVVDRGSLHAGRPVRSVPTSATRQPPPARPAPPPRSPGPPFPRLLVWPVLLSLAVTLFRLLGEYLRWSPEYFNRLPGGGLSPLGITWLVPIFGFYFGWKLQRLGSRPWSVAQAAIQPPAALLLAAGAAMLLERLRAAGELSPLGWIPALVLWAAVSVVALAIGLAAWPALGSRLLAYALLARIPVVVVMGAAMHFGWQTHYDAVPPDFPSLEPLRRWLWLALVPQLTIWTAFTVGVGGLFGGLGHVAATTHRRLRPGD